MTTILIKKKDTAGAPAAGDLTNAAGGAEIAVNTATKRVYSKDSGGTVIEMGTFPSTMAVQGALSATGNVTLGDAAADNVTVNGTITSNLLFTDATYDIGASGATRPRDMFLSRNLTVGGTLTLAGGVNLNGNVTVGDASTDTLTINSTITSNLIFTDNTYDIGASGATRPRNLFLAGNATIGGAQTLTGALTVDSTTDSTSTTTGSIQTDGGVGIAKALFVGTTANIAGVATFSAGTAALPAITTTGDTNTGIWFPAADTIAFTEGGAESMRIDSSGRLLVGTTASQTLSTAGVIGNLQIETANGSANATMVRNTANTTGPIFAFGKSRGAALGSRTVVVSGDILGEIRFDGADGTNMLDAASITAQVDGTPGTNDMPGRLVFNTTADGASSPTERMRITSAGLVGIGTSTTTPRSTLNVVGDITLGATPAAATAGTAYAIIGNSGTSGNAAGGNLTIQAGGGSGIATNGDLVLRAGQTISPASLTTGGNVTIEGGKASDASLGGDIAFNTYAGGPPTARERMRITNAGNVGIGTSSPDTKLVSNYGSLTTINTADIRTISALTLTANDPGSVTSSSGVALTLRPISDRGAVVAIVGYNSSTNKEDTGTMAFLRGGSTYPSTMSESMRINNSGYLGINTTAPNFLAHISTGSTTSITQPTANSYGLYIQQNTSGSVGGLYIQDGASNSGASLFIADNNNAARFVVGADGNVGIGSSPVVGKVLTVTNTGADASVRINAPTGYYSYLELTENSSLTANEYWQIGKVPTTHALQFWNGSERGRFTSGGNLLIGTTTAPTQNVTTAGSLVAVGSINSASGNIGNTTTGTSYTLFTAVVGASYIVNINAANTASVYLVTCELSSGAVTTTGLQIQNGANVTNSGTTIRFTNNFGAALNSVTWSTIRLI